MVGRSSGKLKVTLRGDLEIVLTRVFDAPRHLVFEVMTRAEHIRRWWCMEGFQMPVCDVDFRVGGTYRYLMVAPDGSEVGFRGEFREIVPPERVVQTEIFEPFPDSGAVDTMTLEERDGKTHYQVVVVHKTKQDRDMHVSSGMEEGAGLSLDRVEEIAQALLASGRSGAAPDPRAPASV